MLAVEKITQYFRPYQRDDVVVFRAPPAFADYVDEKKANEDLIKRIIAVEGDTIKIERGKVYINEQEVQENFINGPPNYDFGPVTVPAGCVLVLGKEREERRGKERGEQGRRAVRGREGRDRGISGKKEKSLA
eukprot:759335-Hanusia_phi.AAC.3